jgi:hypothetical protein
MLPIQLVAENFQAYPAEAKRLAVSNITLLRRLPLGFVPLLLREVIVYDWKFPAERRDIDGQFAYLSALSAERLTREMAPFHILRLTDALGKLDWVNSPAVFTEQLTAHLWSTHQIDAFRVAAVDYVGRSSAASTEAPLPAHRLGIVVIGQSVRNNSYRLFRKLRPQGTYFTQVKHTGGVAVLAAAVQKRAAAHPLPYAHWHIDGDDSTASLPKGVAHVSYAALSPVRSGLQRLMQKSYEANVFDPEAFRTRLAQTRMEDIGMNTGGDGVLNRFQLSLLTEGSGTQVFATTFVQWAARETLRRAQPLTLMARFTPRQRENPMNELLAEGQRRPELDPQGSLVDADMGAYYTWLNQQRLTGASEARFLAWFEDHEEAVAIGPGFERNERSDTPIDLEQLAARIT